MNKDIYSLFREAADEKRRMECIKSIRHETGLDERTIRAIIKIINNETAVQDKDLDLLADKSFYTFDNMVSCAKQGLGEIIPVSFYEDDSFLQAAGIDTIPDMLAAGNLSITQFRVSPLIKRIGYGAFMGCSLLLKVKFDDNGSSNMPYLSIGPFSFFDCYSLEHIDLPERCTYIRDGAFSGSGLCDITLPAGLNAVGPYSFCSCSHLKVVDAAEENIGIDVEPGAFERCKLLSSFNAVPTAVKKNAFSGCGELRQITISAPLVGKSAFKDCGKLSKLRFLGTAPSIIDTTAFEGCKSLKHVYYDGFSYELRESDGYWSMVDVMKQNISSADEIDGMFEYRKSVHDVLGYIATKNCMSWNVK